MSKAKGGPARLEVGAEVVRTPQTFYEADAKGKAEHRPMWGRVVYIHPRGLFHTVEFQTRGGAVKESFQGGGGIAMNFLERNGLQTTQTHFKDIFQNNIHRNYADTMLGWLERETDFSQHRPPRSTTGHTPAACWCIA